jgi:MFS family permease
MNDENQKNFRYNLIVNLFDGSFFGAALGFASFSTILPLFVSNLTNSAVLIGLIPAIHAMGWHLPQIFTARTLSKKSRIKSITLVLATQERLPFLIFAIIAFFEPVIGPKVALIIMFISLVWQGLGAGITANPWQNLVGKVFPTDFMATFFGTQNALSNLLASITAILAGYILDRLGFPNGYALCFLAAFIFMIGSWFSLSRTREPEKSQVEIHEQNTPLWLNIKTILKKDSNFCWFLASRYLFQFGMMAFAYYMVFVVKYHHIDEIAVGVLTGVLLMTQVFANTILGWVSDHWSRKGVLEIGALAACLSAVIALLAPTYGWFYLVIILDGIANTVYWTIGMAFSLDFGTEAERPTYVGLANTLVAPSAILAPLFGGWLADNFGYNSTFLVTAIFAVLTTLMMHFFIHNPAKRTLAPVVVESNPSV